MARYRAAFTGKSPQMFHNDPTITSGMCMGNYPAYCSFSLEAANPAEAVGRVAAVVSNIIYEHGATVCQADGDKHCTFFNAEHITPGGK